MAKWQPFDVSFQKGGQVLTWLRFAPSVEFAIEHAAAALAREYGQSVTLISVQTHKGGV